VTVPVDNVDTVTQAWPATSATVWFGPPSPLNVTVPVGVPEPGAFAVTVAHTVTDCPHTDGFGVTDTEDVVDASFTVTDAVPVDGRKQASSPL
jgi:hypothetical protein